MKIIALIVASTAVIIGSSGCMSLDARAKGTQSGLYPGIKAGTEYNEGAADNLSLGAALGQPIVTIDRPFSFALDTVLLPIDLLCLIFCGDNEESPEDAPQQ